MVNNKIKELDVVTINTNAYSSSDGIKKGKTGTVVEIYGGGVAYEVEFVNKNGRTDALLTLEAKEIN